MKFSKVVPKTFALLCLVCSVVGLSILVSSCATMPGASGTAQASRAEQNTRARAALIEAIQNHQMLQVPRATDAPDIPPGYNKTGFLNFAGEVTTLENRDYYAGLLDPEVIGIQVGGWWSQIEVFEGVYDWRAIDDVLELWGSYGKGVVLAIADSYFNTHDTPQWIFDKYRIRRIAEGILIDFESSNPYVEVIGPGQRTTDRSRVIRGIRSVYSENRGAFLETRTGVLDSGKTYGFQFDYKSLSGGTFRIVLEGLVGTNVVRESYTWNAEPGQEGLMSWTAPPAAFRNPQMRLEVLRGDVTVDNLTIHEITARFRGNVGMPNYFDPDYRPHFERFVQAMGERYRDHPALLGVYVTGIGHWGEPNLTGDEPDPINRVRQWHTFGYTEEKFIEHIDWAAQMFRRHFPENNLILVTGGFGINPAESDQEMLYWSLANIIEQNGLIKKFNGIQEAYGLWNPDLEPKSSQRFRMQNDMIIYLETAAQSYRNAFMFEPHWTGNGMTLMNKVLIEGASWMNLYTHDLLTRNVNKYMHFAAEQMGRELYNNQFILFGAFPEANLEHPIAPVPFYNRFDGIFHNQHITSEARKVFSQAVDYGVEQGEHAIYTAAFDSQHFHDLRALYERNARRIGPAPTSGETWIELDVNSRRRYSGMFGTTVTVSYLDRGNDTLIIQALTEPGRDEFTTLDEITKSNTDQWTEVSYYAPEYFFSWQNREPDDQVILRIGDRDDGREWIRAVFLDYVAAEDYKSLPVPGFAGFTNDPSIPNLTYTLLEPGQTLVRQFQLPPGQVANHVSLPFWHGGRLVDKSTVRARFWGQGPDGWELLRDKEFFYGKTGDLIELHGAGRTDFTAYRVELEHVLGQVGWITDEEGELGLIVRQYHTRSQSDILAGGPESQAGASNQAGASGLAGQSNQVPSRNATDPRQLVWFDLPTTGLHLSYTEGTVPAAIVVEKLVPNGGSWVPVSPALVPVEVEVQDEAGQFRVFFEPQTPGQYRIQPVRPDSGLLTAEPLVLERARTPKPALKVETGEPVARFPQMNQWNTSNAELSAISGPGGEDLVRLNVTGPNPKVIAPVSFQGGRNQHLNFSLSNPSPAPMVRVFWRTENQEFNPERSLYIPVVPNDPTLRWYSYNVGEDIRWMDPDGNRSEIVELGFQMVTALNAGYVDIGSVWVGQPAELLVWDFEPGRNMQNTLVANQSPRNRVADGKLIMEGRNAGFIWPRSLNKFWAEPGQSVSLVLQNSSDADTLVVSFEVQQRDEIHMTHGFESRSVSIPLVPNDNTMRTYQAQLPWDDFDSRKVFEFSFQFNNTRGAVSIDEIVIR